MELSYLALAVSLGTLIAVCLTALFIVRQIPTWAEAKLKPLQKQLFAMIDDRLDALAQDSYLQIRSSMVAHVDALAVPDESRLDALETRIIELALLLDGHCSENTTQLAEIQALMANLVATPETEPQEDEVPNPHGCTITTHVWRRRPSLKNDHEYIYYCAKGCNSSLHHRFE